MFKWCEPYPEPLLGTKHHIKKVVKWLPSAHDPRIRGQVAADTCRSAHPEQSHGAPRDGAPFSCPKGDSTEWDRQRCSNELEQHQQTYGFEKGKNGGDRINEAWEKSRKNWRKTSAPGLPGTVRAPPALIGGRLAIKAVSSCHVCTMVKLLQGYIGKYDYMLAYVYITSNSGIVM